MKYHDTVYGKLPKQRGTRLLTEAADSYSNDPTSNILVRGLHVSTHTLFAVDCWSDDIVFQWFIKMPETQKAPGKECIDTIIKMKLSLCDKENKLAGYVPHGIKTIWEP